MELRHRTVEEAGELSDMALGAPLSEGGSGDGRQQPQEAKHPYFQRVELLLNNLTFTLAFSLALENDFKQALSTYFVHMLILLVVLFFLLLTVQDTVDRWSRTGDQTLRQLWYKFLQKFVTLGVSFLSLTVARIVSDKLARYLRQNSVLSLRMARPLVIFGAISFSLTVFEYLLTRPKRRAR